MKGIFFILSAAIFCSVQAAKEKVWSDEEETPEYWLNSGKEELNDAINLQMLNMNVARNVIMFLGDGMGVPTITAGRILKGQLEGKTGEESVLAMDRFSHLGLSRTYAVDKQVSGSAVTATAYLCGVKANYYTIGLSAKAKKDNCSSSKGNEVDSILVDAYKAEKSTGFVTTTRIVHASPAGTYAHTPNRRWYGNADVPSEAVDNGCKDIAQQFYDSSDKITVALGGGRKYFQPNTTNDPEYPNSTNERTDGKDLIQNWMEFNKQNGHNAKYVWNKDDFDGVNPVTTDRLLGLFEPSDMQYEADRNTDSAGEPSLAEMTEKAIRILQKNSKGFFLFVEGGRIDHAHHAANAYRALHDFLAFDDAIAKAVEMTSESDTLIIVTADHSHTFNFGGYTDRGNPIFGLAVNEGELSLGDDNKPFTSLLYGNGQGYQGTDTDPLSRQNLTNDITEEKSYYQQSAVPLYTETHGGEDVPIMAMGPMSHLIHGVHQQSYIAYMMRYASCLGTDMRHCEGNSEVTPSFAPTVSTAATFLGMGLDSTDAEVALNVLFSLMIVFFVFGLISCFVAMRKNNLLKNDNHQIKL